MKSAHDLGNLSKGVSVRDLDGLVRRRALEVIKRLDKKARDDGDGSIDYKVIADRMAEFMGVNDTQQRHAVRKQLKRYLYGEKVQGKQKPPAKWRIDYIQAFGDATGTKVEDLVGIAAARETGISEATPQQHLYAALGRRLQGEQGRSVIRLLQQLLDNRPRFKVLIRIAEALLAAKSAADAHLDVTRIVLDASAAFDAKPRNLRSKPETRQKVRKRR